jgi:hypothetical protein
MDEGGSMARRVLTLITTLCLWAIGGVLLAASAGILFSAMLHRFGSGDWVTYTSIGIALAAGGTLTIASGLWLAVGRRRRSPSVELDDDAMWIASAVPRRQA